MARERAKDGWTSSFESMGSVQPDAYRRIRAERMFDSGRDGVDLRRDRRLD
jgi:hypothetical protein